jgi:hypothetical protein
MSIKIKQANNQSEIKILRRYGHRVFVEMNEKMEPIGHFVEVKVGEEEEDEGKERTREFKGQLARNAALMWSGKGHPHYRPDTAIFRIAEACKDLAAKPARRSHLTEVIKKVTGINEITISTSISTLYKDGYLKVAGEE